MSRVVWLLIGVGVALRCLFPEADPVHPSWAGWVIDEGRWTETAREWSLFRLVDLDTDISRIHLLLAPAYQAMVAASFEVFGTGFGAARLPSRVAGVAVLLLVTIGLRPSLGTTGWLVTAALMALHPELVYFSRVAIPEMPALMCLTAAFLLLVRTNDHRGAVGAGLLTLMAFGVKATTAIAAPGFVAIAWLSAPSRDRAFRRCGVYALSLVLPGAVLVVLLGAYAMLRGGVVEGGFDGAAQVVLGFISPASVYGVASTLHEHDAVHVNLMLVSVLPMWLAIAALRPPPSPALRIFVAANVWIAAWLVPWALTDYFPARYLVHVFVPFAIAVGAGLTVLRDERARGRPLTRAWSGLSPIAFRASSIILCLPLAALATASAVALLGSQGIEIERLRWRIVAVVLSASASGLWLGTRHRSGSRQTGDRVALPWPYLITFFLTVIAAWSVFIGPAKGGFWRTDPEGAAAWIGLLLVGLVVTGAVRRWSSGPSVSASVAAYAAALCVGWTFTDLAPAMIHRSAILPDVSAALEERYSPRTPVGTWRSASAFLGTSLRYDERTLDVPAFPAVTLEGRSGPRGVRPESLREHRPVAVFRIPGHRYYGREVGPPIVLHLWERVESVHLWERIESVVTAREAPIAATPRSAP